MQVNPARENEETPVPELEPFTVEVRAIAAVSDYPALLRHLDHLVALSPDFERIEGGTYWDGSEEREGSGYLFHGDAVWLDDDEGSMLELALGLTRLTAKGVDLDIDADVDALPASPEQVTYDVHVAVSGLEITEVRRAVGWLGAVRGVAPLVVAGRAAIRLVERVPGVDFDNLTVTAIADGSAADPATERLYVTNPSRHRTDGDGEGAPHVSREGDAPPPLRLSAASAASYIRHLHPIPAGRGFLRDWVDDNAPGWTPNDLTRALKSAGLIERPRDGSMPELSAAVLWIDVEPIGVCSRVELDPEALRSHRR